MCENTYQTNFHSTYCDCIAILLVLFGFDTSSFIESQSVTASTLPVPGTVDAKIDCAALTTRDFSKIPDAAAKIMSANMAASSTNSSQQTCKIAGITAPKAMFVIQLPVKGWNGDYFQGGCGGLCGSLREPAECATALERGAAIGYSDLGHESTALNDASWALNNNLRIDFAYHANHALALAAKEIINA
jgi:hypothetical protein